jgi:hypothetical protein
MSVTTTSLRQGKFEARFWHRTFEEEVGRVKGHFGPLNTYVIKSFPSRLLMTFAFLLPLPFSPGPGLPFIRRAPRMRPDTRTVSSACTTLTRATSKRGPVESLNSFPFPIITRWSLMHGCIIPTVSLKKMIYCDVRGEKSGARGTQYELPSKNVTKHEGQTWKPTVG